LNNLSSWAEGHERPAMQDLACPDVAVGVFLSVLFRCCVWTLSQIWTVFINISAVRSRHLRVPLQLSHSGERQTFVGRMRTGDVW
jgi:hypothetical protein